MAVNIEKKKEFKRDYKMKKKNERNKIMNGEILNLHFLLNLFTDFNSCRFHFSENQKVKTISYLFFFF